MLTTADVRCLRDQEACSRRCFNRLVGSRIEFTEYFGIATDDLPIDPATAGEVSPAFASDSIASSPLHDRRVSARTSRDQSSSTPSKNRAEVTVVSGGGSRAGVLVRVDLTVSAVTSRGVRPTSRDAPSQSPAVALG